MTTPPSSKCQPSPSRTRSPATRLFRAAAASALAGLGTLALAMLAGCEVDSFFDPSKTGSFSTTPSTMPVLTRLDVIESDTAAWRNAAPPTPEDLVPSDVFYRLAPGDAIRIDLFELQVGGQTTTVIRIVDQAGMIRVPMLGEIRAAGLTPQELENALVDRLRDLVDQPIVTVSLEQERNLLFTIMGRLQGTGPYRLTRPDLRLLEALAIAGGVPETTDKIFVIRRIPLDETVAAPWDRQRGARPGPREPAAPMDIEALIRELEQRQPGPTGGAAPPPADAGQAQPGAAPGGRPPMGMLRQGTAPPVDIDDLLGPSEPVRVSDRPPPPGSRQTTTSGAVRGPGDSFVFDQARNAWVRVPASAAGRSAPAVAPPGQDILDVLGGQQAPGAATGAAIGVAAGPLFAERVIEIDYRTLIGGASHVNIVIRPGDLIYVQAQDFGFVYIEGEILRPGVYELPITGGLTVSRLVASAGGLGPIAIPERVDLTRSIGPNREATIRVNLAAIRRRTEPDILVRPGDHVIVGTNFWALPLAVIRNGFRMTYGFGFLLDRNFGNDVFGAPPTNIGNQ
ncbi:MAG TPA: polysaccharide biosynthesis/export family protein [Phycisphaerales bacterium]|nr:polysaccharide biosynthesis/export family protein [Phycisphaerales bacterium]HMP38278.1 polysaccharide biosynthesis/export family protein [Phycisphaerales bacterium]